MVASVPGVAVGSKVAIGYHVVTRSAFDATVELGVVCRHRMNQRGKFLYRADPVRGSGGARVRVGLQAGARAPYPTCGPSGPPLKQ